MKIITVTTNNPLFIEMQYYSINKFCKFKNEFIVFNDAKNFKDITNFDDLTIKTQIENTCNKLNIKCINIPNERHRNIVSSSIRHGDSVNFITLFMINNPDTYFMIDCDMFFIDNFNIADFEKYNFCYVEQSRTIHNKQVCYPWPNLFYINMNNITNKKLINWSPHSGLDSGGKNAKWLTTLPNSDVFKIQYLSSCNWSSEQIPPNINQNIKVFLENDTRNKNNKYFSEIYNNNIFHYRGGSNWMNQSKNTHDNLTFLLQKTLHAL